MAKERAKMRESNMQKLGMVTAALWAGLLAGCGGGGDSEIASGTVTDADGKSVDYAVSTAGDQGKVSIKTDEGEISFGGDAASAKLPDGFALYPGAKLTGGFASTMEGKVATMANFEVKGTAAAVIAFYRKQAEAAGLKIAGEISSPGSMILTANAGDGADKPRSVQITAAEADGVVTGSIMAQRE